MIVWGEAVAASPFQDSLEKSLPMSMVGFPLLLIPLAIYNIIGFLMPGVDPMTPLVTLPLITSGAQWPVTLSDVLVALGILMLLFEVMKGARPGAKFLTDHLLSLIVFGGAVAEFVLLPRFATSTFFLLTLLALADFISGVTLRTRRSVPATAVSGRAARRAEAQARQEEVRQNGATQEPVVSHADAPHPAGDAPDPVSGPAHSEILAPSEPGVVSAKP
jgi:hypothetical protein